MILFLAFFLSLPFALLSQEEDTKEAKEHKVTVKIVKEIDGQKTVKDTTFTVTGDEDVKKVVKSFTMDVDSDTDSEAILDVMVDVDDDVEWKTEKGKKVIVRKRGGKHDIGLCDDKNVKVITIDEDGNKKVIVKSGAPHGHKKVMKFKSGDGEDEEVFIFSPHGKHSNSFVWVDEDGEMNDFEFDFEMDMENFSEEMEEMKAELKEMQIRILDEEGQLYDELAELGELKELDELKNVEVIVVPSRPSKAHSPEFYRDFSRSSHRGMKVTDKELREAGIKNKPDRLDLEEIDIEKDNGVIELSFSLAEEGTPKVVVYNIYGDKIFNGKPALLNNKYETKIDLSKKQHGTYYLMIVVGNSSKTIRIRN